MSIYAHQVKNVTGAYVMQIKAGHAWTLTQNKLLTGNRMQKH